MTISKALIKRLPSEEQGDVAGIVSLFMAKQGAICALCDGIINENNDDLALDHIVPESDDGPTSLANLQLTHASCNHAKRNSDNGDIRPYLRLRRFINDSSGNLNYSGLQPHFGISPKESTIRREAPNQLGYSIPGVVKKQHAPVFRDILGNGDIVDYCFIEVTRDTIFNDESVQPRNIKLEHLNSIFLDLYRNPLHEPPSCRCDLSSPKTKILMFDGQHKTVANWMRGRNTIVIKLYLDLSEESAIHLVNSIQAKIKKLTLSAFELAAKMADEFKNALNAYESGLPNESSASEAGFIAWLPTDTRNRGKSALASAVISSVLDSEELTLKKFTETRGTLVTFTETTIKNKILGPLLYTKPLTVPSQESSDAREAEVYNAIRIVNRVMTKVFDLADDEELTPQLRLRASRMSYTQALQFVFTLCRQIYAHNVIISPSTAIMGKRPTTEQWIAIERSIDEVIDHLIWTAPDDSNDYIKPILNRLKNNEEVTSLMDGVALSLADVVVGLNKSERFKAIWKKK